MSSFYCIPSFSCNQVAYMDVGRAQQGLAKMQEINKATYEANLIKALDAMKKTNDELDKKKAELQKIKEKQKELKELCAMQYEEKLQIITQKRLDHIAKMEEIDREIREEDERKKRLIEKQQLLVVKFKDLMHMSDSLLTDV